MNKFFITTLMLLLYLSATAQNTATPNEQLQLVFAPLNKSVMTTGYLVNQQFSFVEPGLFQGNTTDTSRADINVFGILFGSMHNSRIINGGGLPMRYPSFLDSVKTCKPDLAIPIAVMTWKYERIVTEFALQHNLITQSNN
jgi:hypothetical protein